MLRIGRVSGVRTALIALFALVGAAGARADVYDITFINVTFSTTCIGGTGTCTEIINGSGLYDSGTKSASGLSVLLVGSLNASLDAFGAPPLCVTSGCFGPPVLYDSGVLPGYQPIEFSPTLPTFDAPTPEPLGGGPNGTELFVPGMCGGDQPNCNQPGAFPGGPAADYEMASRMYTSVDVSPGAVPEPGSYALLLCGLVALMTAGRWRAVVAMRPPRQSGP
jgi:hypothetical protein